MNDQPRIGLVGCGKRGAKLLRNLHEVREQRHGLNQKPNGHPAVAYQRHARLTPSWAEDWSDLAPRVTAVADPDQAARERVIEKCREHGGQPAGFTGVEAMLKSGAADAVIVATANDRHVDVVLPVLEANVDVFCEKPVAVTLEEHDRIIAAAEKSKSKVFVGFNLRSSPLYRRVRELASAGALGQVHAVSCREVRGPFIHGYRYEGHRSGGALLEKNVHDFDLFNWFLNARPVRVSAFGGQHVLSRDTPTLDAANVIVEYDEGQIAALELCLYAPFGQPTRTYEVRGSEGLLRSPDQPGAIDLFTIGRRERIEFQEVGGHAGGDLIQMKRFLDYLRGKADPPATLREARTSAAIALAAQQAIVEQQVVTL